VKGKGTIDAIFIVTQMQAKFRAKGKKHCYGFVHLEKAIGGVLREVIGWAICKLAVEEWLVSALGSHVYVYKCKSTHKNSVW